MGLFIIVKRKASCVCFYSKYYVKFFNTGSSKRPFSFRIVKGRDNMTELEKEKLFKLRVQGCDWEFISKELSVPENTLKSYCYRNGLTDNDIPAISECCFCHKPVSQKPKGNKRLFCSEKCRSAWRRVHHKLKEPVYHHICVGCGAAFDTVGNKSQRYCSMDCYRKNRCGGAS